MISVWINRAEIEILNVTGSNDPETYQRAREIIESICPLSVGEESNREKELPKTVDEAVDYLIKYVDLKFLGLF